MNINISEFKDVLKKATINFSLDSVQLNFTRDRVKSKMVTNGNEAIVILDLPNTVIPGITEFDEHQFNFTEPNSNLVPYIGLIDDNEQANIEILREKIVLSSGNLKSNIFFCDPTTVAVFNRDNIKDAGSVCDFKLTAEFIEQFNMIKKIGMRFGKIYFCSKNKELVMETTDKTNRFSNGLKFNLFDIESADFSICFDYKNFVNVMSSIDDDYENFELHIIISPTNPDMGFIYLNKIDNSERYYLMSKNDI